MAPARVRGHSPASSSSSSSSSKLNTPPEELVQPGVHHGLQVDEAQQDLRPLRLLLRELLQLADQQAGVLLLLQVTVRSVVNVVSVSVSVTESQIQGDHRGFR